MKRCRGLFLLLLLLLCGCDTNKLMHEMAPEGSFEFAKTYTEAVRNRDEELIYRDSASTIAGHFDSTMISTMAAYFPEGKLLASELVGIQVLKKAQVTKTSLTLQNHYESGWLLVVMTLENTGAGTLVSGFRLNKIPGSLEKTNAFSMERKRALYYVFILLMILIPVFSISVLVLCIKTPIAVGKWRWILAILLSVFSFTINWTTNLLTIKPVSILLLGASAFRSGLYGAWHLSIALPVGAVVFLLRRDKIRDQARVVLANGSDAEQVADTEKL